MESEIREKLLGFAKDSYDHEINIKNAINSRFPSIATTITVLFGALVYFVKTIDVLQFTFLKCSFYVCLVLYAISLGFSLFYLFKCLFTYRYSYVANPSEIHKHFIDADQYNEDVIEHNKKKPSQVHKELIDLEDELFEVLQRHYSSSACTNRINNKRKNGYFIRTLYSVFVGIICLIATAFFYHANRICYANNKPKTTVVDKMETKKMFQENENQHFKSTDGDPNQEEPQRPIPPEPEMIIEAELPPLEIQTKTPKTPENKQE